MSDAEKFVPNFENDHFTTISSHFFCRLHNNLSQKQGSDNHFEVKGTQHVRKLIQQLYHKAQSFPFPDFCNFVR